MRLSYKKNVILNIMKQQSNLGKTAVMKTIYMLQQVKKVKMGYDFEIYTYGPYSSDVTEDIDSLIEDALIDSKMYLYNNYVGYSLNISEKGKTILLDLKSTDKKRVDEVLSFTSGKTARELELYSTIIYVDTLFAKNKWKNEKDDVIKNVHELKPHFEKKMISDSYAKLLEKKFIKP